MEKKKLAPHYQKYIDGQHWQSVRMKYKNSRLSQVCAVCGSRNNLVLHHRTYNHLYKEHISIHVHFLCWECHQRVHFDESGYKTPLTWKALTTRETYLRKSFKKYGKFKVHPETIKRMEPTTTAVSH